jgi:hypothetical protein
MYVDRDEEGRIVAMYGHPKNDNHEFVENPVLYVKKTSKEGRDEALKFIVYDFGDGRVIQLRAEDESNIRNAIESMTRNAISSIKWVMTDNVKYPITASELQTALEFAQDSGLPIWDAYEP